MRAAFGYFSVLPIPGLPQTAPSRTAVLTMLPLVGCVIGALSGFGAFFIQGILPRPFPALAAFAGTLLLSGAIHFDGFLDCCDALCASVPAVRRFEILKDPRHGTYAMAGAATLVPIWLAALAAIPVQELSFVMPFSAALARWAAIINAQIFPYRSEGSSLAAPPPLSDRLMLIMQGMVLCAAAARWYPPAVLLVPIHALLAVGGARWIAGQLDGILVGDAFGALIVIGEVFTLIIFSALQR